MSHVFSHPRRPNGIHAHRRVATFTLAALLCAPLALVACGNSGDEGGEGPTLDGGSGGGGSDGSTGRTDGSSSDGGRSKDADAQSPLPSADGGSSDGGHLGEGDAAGTTTTSTFTIGGEVSGLATGATLILEDNAGDALTLQGNGAFTFGEALAAGASYAVTVETDPTSPAQTCTVTNGTGTVASSAVITVQVLCTTSSFTVGGSVTGLAGTGLVLADGLGHDLAVSANGAFSFPAPVASGASYTVTVSTQPSSPTQTCVVSGGSGSVGGGNVTDVVVNCAANTYTVGGSITGLVGTGLALQNNGADTLSVNTANGTFAFPTPVSSGQMYAVTVLTQPSSPTQSCTVTGGGGTIAASNVTSVAVACSTKAFTISGKVTGLASGDSIVLTDNGGDAKTLTSSGNFTFATSVASGASYAVAATVSGPTAQSCTVTNGSATVGSANVTNVAVACTTESFTVGGTVSGLPTGTVTLQDNGGDTLAVTGNGSFTFKTKVASGAVYSVNVAPANTAHCHILGYTGTIAAANVSDIAVLCGTDYYVDPQNGSDTAAGTAGAPWQTVTHAIATLPAAGGTINLASGTYSTGETFPLLPRSHQNIIGSATAFDPSILSGSGYYMPAGGDLGMDDLAPIMAVAPGVTDAGVYNCTFASPASNYSDNIDVDNATFTLEGDTFKSATDLAIAVIDGANVTLIDSAVEGGFDNLRLFDPSSKARVRGTTFTGSAGQDTIGVGYVSDTVASGVLDLGTAGDPGGNIITAAPTGDGLAVNSPNTKVFASGNTWRANVQNASASGTYGPVLVSGPADSTRGDNYFIVATSSIQF